MSVAADYAEAIVRRAREPMEPLDFVPDWADQPFRHKVYRDLVRFPLPAGPATLSPADGTSSGAPAFTLDLLAGMLRHSYGLTGRRLRVNGNDDNDNRPWYRTATWARGTASGGGLYPCEIYWACGPGADLAPGVYHYSTAHHAMQRLLAGDVTAVVRHALRGHPRARQSSQFLLVTVRFWKNAFKYNSFCYHVVTMDLGALLGTWQSWSRASGAAARPLFWFAEEELNRLLGLETADESVMAVVPLSWRQAPRFAAAGRQPPGQVLTGPPASSPRPAVAKQPAERSRRVIRFPWIERVHRATLAGAGDPPPGPALLVPAAARTPARAACLPLPPPGRTLSAGDLIRTLETRRSSFGLFAGQPPLTRAQLATLLEAGGEGRHLASDVRFPDGSPALTRLAVFINHVEGVPPGAYDYDPLRRELRLIPGPPVSPFLQHQYFLHNYNLEQAAAVLVVMARPAAVIGALGDRGYRVINAEVGALAQAVYLAAAALNVGCGAALGFDNVAVAERLGIGATDERPLLLIMAGHERSGQADMHARLP